MRKKIQLIIFDLDGTLVQNPTFYNNVYSQSLNDLIKDLRGEKGLDVLSFYRNNYQGRGELALSALNIPYSQWAEKLEKLPLKNVKKNVSLVKRIRSLKAKKVIYTGSPFKLAERLLLKTGFDLADFDEIIGWEKPGEFPLKWTCSPFVFSSIVRKYNASPQKTYAIGDNATTDILPAQQANIQSIYLQKEDVQSALERIQL